MPSERTYRRALWAMLNDGLLVVADSGTTSSVVAGRLVNATPNASTNEFRNRWVHQATGTQAGWQARVRRTGYVPSTGTLVVYPNWGSPPAGAECEITSLFPCLPDIEADTSYRQLLNQGLGWLKAPDSERISLTTVADQTDYSLSAYSGWLDDPRRITGLYEPRRAVGGVAQPSWRRREVDWTVVWEGGVPKLRLLSRPWSRSGFTFQVGVIRPAFSLISGAESNVGFSATAAATVGTETATVSVADLVEASLLAAYRVLANRGASAPDGVDWRGRAKDQEKVVRGLASYDRIRDGVSAMPEAA